MGTKQTKQQPPKQTWEERYYGQLVGKTIKAVRFVGEGQDAIPTLQLSDGRDVYVQADPEGNGPGFLYGLPFPASEEGR